MANHALFYEQAVPVTRSRHGDWSLEARAGFAFARNTNCLPLTAVEFAKGAMEFPIVFVEVEDRIMPTALVGLRDRENLHVSETGSWEGTYIPAFVRRYPFIFGTDSKGEKFTLCVDESYAGFNREGAGERLFRADGTQSAYLEQVLIFLREYEVQYRLTVELCRQLGDAGLLEPMQANVAFTSGENLALKGFFTISRDRLKSLAAERLRAMVRNNALELVYQHLLSLESFSRLTQKLTRGGRKAADLVTET